MANPDVKKAAEHLHHISMLYSGCIWEMANGKGLIGLPQDHPGLSNVRDLIDQILYCRAEVNALTKCLVDTGLITAEQYTKQVAEEYEYFARVKAKKFGCKVTDYGLEFNIQPPHTQN